MTITEEQLYGMLEGSWEQEFADRLGKDIFGVYGKLPEEALKTLTGSNIEETASNLAKRVTEADNGLGIRERVLYIGLRDRYLGLARELTNMKNDPEKASEQFIKKILTYFPREIMLMYYQTLSVEEATGESEDANLTMAHRFVSEIYTRSVNATSDKANVEDLYFAKTVIDELDKDLEVFSKTLVKAMDRLDIFHKFLYDELYYQPDTLKRAIITEMQNDLNWGNVSDFDFDEYLDKQPNQVYAQYLDKMKPIKETKALGRLWEDAIIQDILTSLPDQQDNFDYFKFISANGITVLLRDGLTVIEPTGRIEHIASSRVKVSDKEELKNQLLTEEYL